MPINQPLTNKIILLISLSILNNILRVNSFSTCFHHQYKNRLPFHVSHLSTSDENSEISISSSDDTENTKQLDTYAKSIEQHLTSEIDIKGINEGDTSSEELAIQSNGTEIADESLPNSPPLSFGKFLTMQVNIVYDQF